MSEKDPAIRVSWLQTSMAVGGVLVAVLLAYGAVRSDVRDTQTVNTSQQQEIVEIKAMVRDQTKATHDLTVQITGLTVQVGQLVKQMEKQSKP